MDYGKGTRLHKYQWDLVHDPKAMLGWFQDEEENAYYGDPYAYLWKEINELTSSINYSLYQFNQWVAESKRSILSLFDFSDVALTSDEAKVYEILTAVKEDDLESLSSYTAEEIITGQDLQLGEESYEKLIVYFLQAPTAIDTKSYQVEDKTEEGYSLLIFSEEGKADEEVLRVQVASEQKEALVVYLFGKEEKAEEKEATDDATYNFFVTDGDAWYREEEAPYKAITPVPSTNVLAKGLRVSVLETLKDDKDKDVAKIELKNSGTIEYTSLSNLSEVKLLSKELKYKMVKDYTAVKLPYSSESTDETYEKDKEFTVYKRCGNYMKVKGKGGSIKGHWIEKTAAVATEPEFEIKTEDLEAVFTSANKETLKEVVELVNKYSNEFGITSKERMAHFLAQIGHETGAFEDLEESCSYSKTNSQLKSFSKYYTSNRKSIAVVEGSEEKSTLKQMQNPNLLKDLTKETIWYFNADRSKMYKVVNGKSEEEHTYKTQYDNGDGIKTKYVNNSVPDCPLFDYVYCCGKAYLGNGDVASKDGSRFRGRGYIHLTGRYNYNKDFYKPWKEEYPDDKRTLNELVDLLRTDKDLAMKAAMVFWKGRGLNDIADNPNALNSDKIVKAVTKAINSGLKGLEERQQYFKNLKDNL